jgi:hypothetical protein
MRLLVGAVCDRAQSLNSRIRAVTDRAYKGTLPAQGLADSPQVVPAVA